MEHYQLTSFAAGDSNTVVLVHCKVCLHHFRDEDFNAGGIYFPPALYPAAQKRKAEYLAGRLAARRAMAGLGLPVQPVLSAEDRSPCWPHGLTGSISHRSADGYITAFCLLGRHSVVRRLGIDCETVMSAEVCQAVKGQFADHAEQSLLATESSRQMIPLPALYTLLFSAKETLFKALYPEVRRYFDFLAAELSGFNWQADFPSADYIKEINTMVENSVCGCLLLRQKTRLGKALSTGSQYRVFFLLTEDQVLTLTLS